MTLTKPQRAILRSAVNFKSLVVDHRRWAAVLELERLGAVLVAHTWQYTGQFSARMVYLVHPTDAGRQMLMGEPQ